MRHVLSVVCPNCCKKCKEWVCSQGAELCRMPRSTREQCPSRHGCDCASVFPCERVQQATMLKLPRERWRLGPWQRSAGAMANSPPWSTTNWQWGSSRQMSCPTRSASDPELTQSAIPTRFHCWLHCCLTSMLTCIGVGIPSRVALAQLLLEPLLDLVCL